MSDLREVKFRDDFDEGAADDLFDNLLSASPSAPQPTEAVDDIPDEEKKEAKSFFSYVGDVVGDVGEGALQAPRAIARGVVGGVEGVAGLGEDLDRLVNSPVLQIIDENGNFNLDITDKESIDAKFGGDAPGLEDAIAKLKLAESENPTFTGKAIENISKFLVGFKGVDKIFKATKAIPSASNAATKAVGTTTKGAIADMLVFDEQEERLSNLVETVPELQNPVTEYLAANENDSFAEAKFKQGLEGAGLGLFVDSLAPAIKIIKAGKNATPPLSKEGYAALSKVKKSYMQNTSFAEHINKTVSNVAKKEKVNSVLTGATKAAGAVKTKGKAAARGFDKKALKVKNDLIKKVYGKPAEAFDDAKILKSAGLVDDPVLSDLMKFASEQTESVKIGWDETNARALGMTVEEARKQFGTSGDFTAAIARVKVEAIARAARLSDSVSSKGLDDADSIEALAEFLEVSDLEKMMSSEAGRALGSLKQTRNVAEVLSGIDATSRAGIEAVLKSFKGDPEKMLGFGRHLGRSKVADVMPGIHSFWINNVLSGPVTHLTNLASNVSFMALRPIERLGASGVGVLSKKQGAYARESLEMYVGFYEGFRDALKVLRKAEPVDTELQKIVRRGTKFDDVGDVSVERGNMVLRKAITGREEKLSKAEFLSMGPLGMGQEMLARALTAPSDFLGSSDQFIKTMAARGQKRALAYRSAMRDGFQGDEFAQRIDDILNNKPLDATDMLVLKNINEAAGYFARETVFQQELGKKGLAIVGFRDDVPGMEYVIPFVKTPINILDETFVKRTPLGLASGRIRSEIMQGGAVGQEAIAKMAIGTFVGGSIVAAYSQGSISGAGPKNKAARERWLETNQPWSVKINDKWYAYNKIEPIGSILGLGARFGEVIEHNADTGKLSPDEQEELAFGMAGAFTKYVTDKSFLAGIDNILSAIEGDEFAVDQFLANTASGFVPFSGMVRTISNAENKELRDMEGILDRIQSGLPGLSENLPHRRNRFGDKIIAADRVLGGVLPISHTPGGVSDKQTQKINEIEQEGSFILSKPTDKIKGVKLTLEQQDERLEVFNKFEIGGKTLKDRIIETAESPVYKEMAISAEKGERSRGSIMKRLYRKYLEQSDYKFLQQNPEISVKIQELYIDSRTKEREINPLTGQPRLKETYIGAE